MPRRTNEFQRFVRNIYDQIEEYGGNVNESVMLPEKGIGTLREVDVLIKKNLFEKDISIAVECRGRGRKDDIEWIDTLIGKYIGLPVDEVIAVSKSGFSEPAKTKAKVNHIKTITLEEANLIDWRGKFLELLLTITTRNDYPRKIVLKTEKPIDFSMVTLQSLIYLDSKPMGTLEYIAKKCYESALEQINCKIKTIVNKTGLQTLGNKIKIYIPCKPIQPVSLLLNDEEIDILEMDLEIECIFNVIDIHPNRYFFDERGITEAKININNQSFQVMAVEERNYDPKTRIYQID